jgi:hypothetical protein
MHSAKWVSWHSEPRILVIGSSAINYQLGEAHVHRHRGIGSAIHGIWNVSRSVEQMGCEAMDGIWM